MLLITSHNLSRLTHSFSSFVVSFYCWWSWKRGEFYSILSSRDYTHAITSPTVMKMDRLKTINSLIYTSFLSLSLTAFLSSFATFNASCINSTRIKLFISFSSLRASYDLMLNFSISPSSSLIRACLSLSFRILCVWGEVDRKH